MTWELYLQLCKELYKISEWRSELTWADNSNGDSNPQIINSDSDYLGHNIYRIAYAYDLGYLLRKLPQPFSLLHRNGEWECGRADPSKDVRYEPEYYWQTAAIPEDAACKLAIELFKSGVLKKGSDV